MKKPFLIKALSIFSVLAVLACSTVGSFALTAREQKSKRTVSVNTSSVIQEDFLGHGNNLWTFPYGRGMNDAYELVNKNRTDMQKPAFMRMMFLPQWIVYIDEEPEVQKQRWESGDYNWNSIEVINFFNKVKMLKEAGTIIELNMGGRISTKYRLNEWYQVPDSSITFYGGPADFETRGAPDNLKAFANATAAVIKKADEKGLDNVRLLCFYNEVNGGNFEAFFDKRVYWTAMIKEVHSALKAAGYRDKNNESKYVKIMGTDFSGLIQDPVVSEYVNYVYENLRNDDGTPIFDILSTHQYIRHETDVYLKNSLEFTSRFSDTPVYNTEGSGVINADGSYNLNYMRNTISCCLMIANTGFAGNALWFYSPERLSDPFNLDQSGYEMCNWDFPTRGTWTVGENNAQIGLFYRYVEKNSKVYKTAVSNDDIYSAAFGKDGGYSVFTEMDYGETNSKRTLCVEFTGDNIPADGTKFERHTYIFPDDDDGDGIADSEYPSYYVDEYGNTVGGANAIIPVTDKIVTVSNGKITDDDITGKHCAVLYTTIPEQPQLEVETTDEDVSIIVDGKYVNKVYDSIDFCVEPGKSVDLSVKKIIGADDNAENVTWEIVGKNPSALSYYNSVYDPATNTGGGYGMTDENCGKLSKTSGKTVTYTAENTEKGDTVAIKVFSNADNEAYKIIIISIGYTVKFDYGYDSKTAEKSYKKAEYEQNLPIPVRNGYTFEGWYDSQDYSGKKYEKTDYDAFNNGITLYAKWSD